MVLAPCPSLILENDVNSVDDTRDVTQNRQANVDEKVGATASLKEHSQRREENGENKLADIRRGQGHFERRAGCF